jgi:alpha-beta hydrolase superfamily lysophospholipase
MELHEDLAQLIEAVTPGDTSLIQLEGLQLHSRYIALRGPNTRQIRLFYRKLQPIEPKASICLVHGFAEHSGRHIGTAARLASAGYEVHMVDLRAFGVSGGAKGANDLHDFQEDLGTLLHQVRADLPCFVMGHSMGGLVVTTLLLHNPGLKLAGAVISSPLYNHRDLSCPHKNAAIGAVAGELKQFVVNAQIVASATSRDDRNLYNLFNDKKMLPLTNLTLMSSFAKAFEHLPKRAKEYKFPTIWFHGDADTITECSDTVKLFDKVSSPDKTLKIYSGGYHELHHDLERERFYRELIEWLDQRANAQPIGQVSELKTGVLLPPSPRRWPLFLLLGVLLYGVVAVKYKPRAAGKLLGLVVTKWLPKLCWPVFMLAEKLLPLLIK